MLATTILITGGLVIGGVRIFLKQRRSRTPVWLTQPDGTRVKSYALIVEQDETLEVEQQVDISYTLAAISLGLNVAALLIAQPITLVGLPIETYNLAVIIEQAYDGLNGPSRAAQFVIVSVAIVIFVTSNQFLIISGLQWFYFAYRKTAFELQRLSERLASMPIH